MQLQNKSLLNAAPPARFTADWPEDAAQHCLNELVGEDGAVFSSLAHNAPKLAATLATCAQRAPFLRELIRLHHTFLSSVFDAQPETVIETALGALARRFDSQLALRSALRHARQKLMIYLALADCAQTIDLHTLTHALSDLADAALTASLAFELSQLTQKGDWPASNAAPEACGMAILGLGKLGGHELNYSSDIDLMVYFDPDLFAYTGRKDKKTAAVQLARAVCGHLSAKTSDGFVFRVDLRLRPDPSSTPIAMTLDAAEAYYQSAGLTWERAALIKARHSAGDRRVSEDFLARIRPFVWRRHLDFTAIDDVHAMKQRVHDHHNHKEADTPGPGFDVKLGYGGIREIEFFAQIHQLIMGGKRPELQKRPTCEIIHTLSDAGDIPSEDRDTLLAAYHALRRVEHRLQMVGDAQTHTLPDDVDAANNITAFLGYETPTACYDMLKTHCGEVKQLFSELLQDDNASKAAIPKAFEHSRRLEDMQARWRKKTYRALRSQRALQLLEGLLPDLLSAFANTPEPEDALLAFDTFLSQQPAGVQLLSLLDANRPVIGLLASIMGHSPELRDQLSRRPAMFEGLLSGDLEDVAPSQAALRETLNAALKRAPDYEGMLDTMRIFNHEARFKAGVQLLEGITTAQQTAHTYTDIAQVCISALLERVTDTFSTVHGAVAGGEFIILALGSFGAYELTTSSDLDLTFLYRVATPEQRSDGAKPLPVREYYARLAQRLITAITSLTGEGRLYEVDMRLRPSGRSGIIAVSLDAFKQYHDEKAWLWERMSLTKARCIAGTPALASAFAECRYTILNQPVSAQQVRSALWDMRAKLQAAAPPKPSLWALKSGEGGLTDADFLLEGLLLEHGYAPGIDPETTRWCDWWRILQDQTTLKPHDALEISNAQETLLRARIAKNLLMPRDTVMDEAPAAAQDKLSAILAIERVQAVQTGIENARQIIWRQLNTLLAKD